MTPLRTRWLNNKTCIQPCLLVRGRAKVIVCEHCAQRTIDTEVVQHIVGVPALHCRLRAKRTEERMRFCFRTCKGSVTRVARINAETAVEFSNRLDAFDHLFRTETTVFVIESIPGSV